MSHEIALAMTVVILYNSRHRRALISVFDKPVASTYGGVS